MDQAVATIAAAVIAAIVAGCFSTFICVLTHKFQRKQILDEYIQTQKIAMLQLEASVQQSIAIIDCKFDSLTSEVQKHNSVVERMFKAEKDIEVLKEKQSAANKQLADLKKGAAS